MSITQTLEEIKTETAQLKASVDEAALTSKSYEEMKKEFTERFDKIEEAQKEIRRQEVPKTAVFSATGRLENRTLLEGAVNVSYKELIEMSPSSALVRGTDAAGQLEKIHLYHDAVVIKYWHFKRKHDHTAAVQMIKRSPEYSVYRKLLSEAGYGTPEQLDKSIEDSSVCLRDMSKEVTTKANEVPYNTDSGSTETYLVFTLLSSTVIDMERVERVLMGLVRHIPLQRPSQSFPANLTNNYAVLGGIAVSEPPVIDHSTTVTQVSARMVQRTTWGQISFAVQHCMGFLQWNDDMVEDSIIPWVPQMREELARSLVNSRERSMLQGDATTVHRDYDTENATNNAIDYRRAHFGLRHMALPTALAGGGLVITADKLRLQRAAMGKYGKSSADVIHVITMKQWFEVLKDNDVRTVDKFGPHATVHTGQIASLDNCPLVVSEELRGDVTANGYNETGGTNTFATSITFNRRHFAAGEYGGLNVESTRNAPLLHTILQADERVDFQPDVALTSGEYPVVAGTVYPVAMTINVLD